MVIIWSNLIYEYNFRFEKKTRNDNDINVFKLMVFILIEKMKEFENVWA